MKILHLGDRTYLHFAKSTECGPKRGWSTVELVQYRLGYSWREDFLRLRILQSVFPSHDDERMIYY